MRPLYRFDDVVLDLEAFRLTRGGRPVHLEPKVLELLGYLVQRRGRLAEKQELQAALWSDSAVSESSLTRAVAQLRKALDDDAREARYVETVPTRGYRFRAEVRVEEGRNGSEPPAGVPAEFRDRGSSVESPRVPPSLVPPSRPNWRVGLAFAAAVAAGAALAVALRRAPEPPAREGHRTLISTTQGFNGFPTFSPDGSSLAYSSDRSGRIELYVRPLVPGAREAAVTSDGQDNVQAAWSPDGRYLAYHSMRRGGLWIVPALGGTPRQISETGSAPAWSPDGRRLAFSSLGLAALEGGLAQYSAALRIMDMNGDVPGEPRDLTEPGQPPPGHGPPAFSADGREVYFAADGLWAVRTDGSRVVRPLVAGPVSRIAVSPDGSRIFWSEWDRGNWHLWSARVSPDAPARERVEVASTGDQAPRYLVMSRGGRLACALTTSNSELAIVPLTSEMRPAGPPGEPWPGQTGRKTQLHFSPDGRTLAFARTQAGVGMEVWGLDVATGAARPLLPGADVTFLNGWFPQGDSLLVSGRGAGGKEMLRAPVSGGRFEVLLRPGGFGWARLLRPGQDVVYHAVAGGVLNVHRARFDGGGVQVLTDDPQGVGWPVPSPDGKTIAVEMFRGNDAQLGLLPALGGVARAVGRAPGQHWVHDWSPDSRRVLYAARRDGLWNVYWMDAATGQEVRLTDHAHVREAVRTPSWSPRGDRVAYERLETTGGIWLFDLETAARP